MQNLALHVIDSPILPLSKKTRIVPLVTILFTIKKQSYGGHPNGIRGSKARQDIAFSANIADSQDSTLCKFMMRAFSRLKCMGRADGGRGSLSGFFWKVADNTPPE